LYDVCVIGLTLPHIYSGGKKNKLLILSQLSKSFTLYYSHWKQHIEFKYSISDGHFK